jgi:hypothetical protein
MNLGEYVTRINMLSRQLTAKSASSFADDAVLYELATNIMLEANKIREICQERNNGKSLGVLRFSNIVDESMRILGEKT